MKGGDSGVAVFVSYYAPPAVGIAAQRLMGFLRHLPELGWEPVLVAPADVHFHRTGAASQPLLEGVTVHRTRNPEPSRGLRRLWGHAEEPPSQGGVQPIRPVEAGGVGELLRGLVRDWVYVPDAQLLWVPWAAAAAARAVRSTHAERVALVSSSMPHSAHFAARRAARRTGAPWVAEYRDPWSAAAPQFGRLPKLRQALDRRLDRGIVESADAVVVTSESTARLFEETFDLPAGRLSVVRNGFDPGPEGRRPKPSEPMMLLYSGMLLHASYADPVLEALDRLWSREPGAVCLDVFGPPGPWEAAVSRRGGATPFLWLHGLVPAEQMPVRLASASALLLLQPEPAHAQYIAGKLYEYLGARRPVVAALPVGCEAERLLGEHGDPRLVRPLTSSEVEGVLDRLVREHRAGELEGPRVPAARVEALTRREQTRALTRVLDSVTGRT